MDNSMNSINSMLFMMMSFSKNTNSSFTSFMMAMMMFFPYIQRYFSENKVFDIFFPKKKQTTMIIQTHLIPIMKYMSTTTQYKTVFSESFLAIIYYINTKIHHKLTSVTEIISNNNEFNNNIESSLQYKKDFIFIPINNKNIEVDEEYKIFCDIDFKECSDNSEKKSDDKAKSKTTEYIITLSTSLSIDVLEKFVEKCLVEYNLFLSKKLIYTGQQYIYEYKCCERNENGKYELMYDESLMDHNKDLNKNIFMQEKQKLIDYITPFIYDPKELFNKGEDKYNKCGFTFKAGLFFYGSPGCGKTSTIKAILKYLNRNGVILNLNKVKTCDELKSIFRNRIYNKRNHCGKQLCFILEDCDAFEDNILLNRSNPDSKKGENNLSDELSELKSLLLSKSNQPETSVSLPSSINTDKVNLSCFLNILDGIIELYGVMIIMTTNHPEMIDPALIRPGRFDFNYEFKKASNKIVKEMIQFKYELSDKDILKYPELDQIKDEVLSPAQVQSVCFKNENVENCIRELFLMIQKTH